MAPRRVLQSTCGLWYNVVVERAVDRAAMRRRSTPWQKHLRSRAMSAFPWSMKLMEHSSAMLAHLNRELACTHFSAVISLPGRKIHHTTDSGLPFYLTHDIFQAGMCNDEPGTRETHCGKRQNMCPKFHANTCILPRNMV